MRLEAPLTLVGHLNPVGGLSGSLSVDRPIGSGITIPREVGGEEYDGETIIIPKAFEDIILPTAHKVVRDNIIVKEIPYTEVSNLSGGTTVSIS